MTRERAGGQRCDTCTQAFKASGKRSWRFAKWNFETSVVFTTWRAYALPLFISLIAPICPVAAVGWPCSWQPGGANAALGAPAVVMLPWWLLHVRVRHGPQAGGGGLSSPGAAGRPVLAPTAHSHVLWLFSWMLWFLPGTSIQWAARCVTFLACASKRALWWGPWWGWSCNVMADTYRMSVLG